MRVCIAQISPIFLDREKTLKKVEQSILNAASNKASLVIFGESLIPAYPFWLAFSGGASFDDPIQKKWHARYMHEAVQIERGDLNSICEVAKNNQIAVYLGIVERPSDRGAHTLFCSLVYINEAGRILSVHRKMQPTYEERLCWGHGDAHGLITHPLKEFTVGGLNCWENWMPLSRTALYAQGENLHIAVWPGSNYNTQEITRFIARESRSYVISASSTLHLDQVKTTIPEFTSFIENAPEILANGGSCIANPDGSWLIEPIINSEELIYADLSLDRVFEERQNFDPTGHYSRPELLSLTINPNRQKGLHGLDE